MRPLIALPSSSLLLLVASVSLASRATAQEIQWAQNPGNNHWYGIPFNHSTWSAGESLGVQAGGHLVTIRNASENTWISQNLAGFNQSGTGYWIGLNDEAMQGTYHWTSGEPVSYTHWSSGEPSHSGGLEHDVEILVSNWMWN